MVYSVLMGAWEAARDTYRLTCDQASIPVASMSPGNPLEKLPPVNYRDHLRLFLLLHGDENGKLDRIARLVEARNTLDAGGLYTLADGYAEVSIGMWFFPLAGLDNLAHGPFGTSIRNGRCYISKSVEFGY
jgi:hypothetical protein